MITNCFPSGDFVIGARSTFGAPGGVSDSHVLHHVELLAHWTFETTHLWRTPQYLLNWSRVWGRTQIPWNDQKEVIRGMLIRIILTSSALPITKEENLLFLFKCREIPCLWMSKRALGNSWMGWTKSHDKPFCFVFESTFSYYYTVFNIPCLKG